MSSPGFRHLRGYLAPPRQTAVLAAIQNVLEKAPLFVPTMPKSGRPLSVRMSNCGPLGWITDKAGGYRYEARHPKTNEPWPPIPGEIAAVWKDILPDAPAAEACLVNWYEPTSKLGMHQDRDEADLTVPVVSISLGDDAWFRVGGQKRRDPSQRFLIKSGDVIVLAGDSRLAYHGIDRVLPGTGWLLDAPGRINLTLRRVTPPPNVQA